MEPIKFSRAKPDELVFARILETEPKGVTGALVESASDLLQNKLRELRFNDPKLSRDGFAAFARVAKAHPNAFLIVTRAWTQGVVDDEVAEPDYVEVA